MAALWAVPVAALVGVLGSEALHARPAARGAPAPRGRRRRSADRVGHPAVVERLGERRVGLPRWKLSAHVLAAARTVLGAAHPGDVILAPRPLSQAILKLSGAVVVVDPVDRYVRALRAVPGAHARERVLLEDFAGHGVAPLAAPHGRVAADRAVLTAALRRAARRPRVRQAARSAAHGRCCEPTASPWSRRRGGPRACAARRRRRCHDHARCPGARGSSCWPRSRWAAAAVSRR